VIHNDRIPQMNLITQDVRDEARGDHNGGDYRMTPQEIKQARNMLGLSVSHFATMLETDPQTVRRMEMSPDKSTARKPAVRMCRLINAYIEDYRPKDWPEMKP